MNEEQKIVRPKFRKNKNKHLQKIILGLLIIIIGFLFFTFNHTFRIRNIDIQGNSHYTKEEIMQLVGLEKYRNSLLFYISHKNNNFGNIPFVETIDIKLTSINDIQIDVFEKKVIGCIEFMGMFLYFDKDGVVIESLDYQFEDIPIITGLEFNQVVLYEKILVDDDEIFTVILSIIQLLERYSLKVDKIVITEELEFILIQEDIRVLLGTNQDLHTKITRLKDILPSIQGEKGELYIRDINHRIYFKKDV
jgi:cell division protein FtsQ